MHEFSKGTEVVAQDLIGGGGAEVRNVDVVARVTRVALIELLLVLLVDWRIFALAAGVVVLSGLTHLVLGPTEVPSEVEAAESCLR